MNRIPSFYSLFTLVYIRNLIFFTWKQITIFYNFFTFALKPPFAIIIYYF